MPVCGLPEGEEWADSSERKEKIQRIFCGYVMMSRCWNVPESVKRARDRRLVILVA